MSNSFEETKELWDWYKRIFTVAGVWPLQSAYPTFTFWTVYSCLQFVMDFAYMLNIVDDLDMIMNVGELTWVSMTIPKLIVLRCSQKLANLLINIREEINGENLESIEEKEMYLAYNRMAKSFVKVLGPLTLVGVLLHYFTPFAFLLRAVLLLNESVPLILPFRTHLFFEVNNYFTLSLWWIYQFPMMFVNGFHPVSLCFAVFLIFHACGQLSALAIRIKNLGLELGAKTQGSGATFRHIVETHYNITGITNDINDVFNLLFLEELFMTSVMIILTSYTVIVKFDFSDTSALFTYAVYTVIMFTLIYGSCVAGEYLITESTNVYEAFYQCQWYDLPDTYKKQLIICMIGSSKPIYLLGGAYLGMDNPARYVAAFNKQSKEAKYLAAYAYAALEGSTMLREKYPNISLEIPMSRKHAHKTTLHQQCPRRGTPSCPPDSLRYRTADGSCNNLREPWWGSAMSTMIRFLPPAYDDGIQNIRRSIHGHPLPSPRDISNFIHEDRDVPQSTVTHMLMQWGQFVDHDIVATAQNSGFNGTFPQCCLHNGAGPQSSKLMHPDCLPIIVHQHDSFLGPLGVRCLEFVRSSPAPRENCHFGPREQLSQVTSFLDASMVYSSSTEHSDNLRLFRNGLLQYGKLQSRQPSLPLDEIDSLCQRGFVTTECFKAGDGRLSEQPALLSIHIAFLRLHNSIATKLAAINPHWSDEILYQEARRIVSALIQLVTYREYLPVLLGDDIIKIFDLELTSDSYYNGYNDTVNPNIVNAFSTAAYRFGHSLVQHSFIRVDMQHRPVFNNASIHNEFSNRKNLHSAGSLDRLLLGLVNQPSQKRDEFITAELTNHLFQTPSFKFGMDLASINIQRGRDHGLSPYVAWRSICGLSQIKNWDDFERVTSSSVAPKFRKVYSALEDVDLFSAGLAEKPVLGGLIGPTFACIIAQQFRNLRKGDRFWFENPNRESSFTVTQLQQVKKVTLARILCDTMENIETIQPFVFLTPDTLRNNRVPCDNQIIGNLNLQEWAETVVMPTNE